MGHYNSDQRMHVILKLQARAHMVSAIGTAYPSRHVLIKSGRQHPASGNTDQSEHAMCCGVTETTKTGFKQLR